MGELRPRDYPFGEESRLSNPWRSPVLIYLKEKLFHHTNKWLKPNMFFLFYTTRYHTCIPFVRFQNFFHPFRFLISIVHKDFRILCVVRWLLQDCNLSNIVESWSTQFLTEFMSSRGRMFSFICSSHGVPFSGLQVVTESQASPVPISWPSCMRGSLRPRRDRIDALRHQLAFMTNSVTATVLLVLWKLGPNTVSNYTSIINLGVIK